MGLPASQERVLDRMEGALKASEPHLAAMFAIFTRLSAGEPVGRESLLGRRRRWWLLRPGTNLAALVLIPVMFAVILTGVLLGGPTRAGTCAVGMPAAGAVPRAGQSSCGVSARPGRRPPATIAVVSCPAPARANGAATITHLAVWARDAAISWPAGRAGTAGLC
jgi:hypothetical protein